MINLIVKSVENFIKTLPKTIELIFYNIIGFLATIGIIFLPIHLATLYPIAALFDIITAILRDRKIKIGEIHKKLADIGGLYILFAIVVFTFYIIKTVGLDGEITSNSVNVVLTIISGVYIFRDILSSLKNIQLAFPKNKIQNKIIDVIIQIINQIMDTLTKYIDVDKIIPNSNNKNNKIDALIDNYKTEIKETKIEIEPVKEV